MKETSSVLSSTPSTFHKHRALFFLFTPAILLTTFSLFYINHRNLHTDPTFLLAFHTSNATKIRLKTLLSHITKFRNKTILVASKEVQLGERALYCDCNDKRLSPHGLNCRLDCLFHYFAKRPEGWVFIGGDDDWINEDALERLIKSLSSVYNPSRDPIFIGNLQQMHNISFPHGGPGYIASKAFVNQLLQKSVKTEEIGERGDWVTDDIAMGITLKEKFPQVGMWASPWTMVAIPHPASLGEIIKENWDSLEPCPNDVLRPSLRDFFSVHLAPFDLKRAEALEHFKSAPQNVKVVAEKFIQISFCKCLTRWCDLKMNGAAIKARIKSIK